MVSSIMLKLVFFSLLFLAIALEVVGDIFLKKWSLGGKSVLMAIGFMLYVVASLFWAFSLKYEYLSKAISIFTVLNLICVVLVGVLMFEEKLSLVNIIGMVLGLVSVVLVQI